MTAAELSSTEVLSDTPTYSFANKEIEDLLQDSSDCTDPASNRLVQNPTNLSRYLGSVPRASNATIAEYFCERFEEFKGKEFAQLFVFFEDESSGNSSKKVESLEDYNEGDLRLRFERLERIFGRHSDEEFEPGFISKFEVELKSEFEADPYNVVAFVSRFLSKPTCAEEVVGEAIRMLGRLETGLAEEERFQVLSTALRHNSSHIRDCAALALYDLRDARAVEVIEGAIEREPLELIRSGYEELLEELKGEG